LAVGRALHYSHQQGMVHRDVKPQNILLDRAGKARLSDFDLVMARDTPGNTRSGGGLGTYFYAAPEAQQAGKDADHQADVYSLGMTTLFVLQGRELTQEVMYARRDVIEQLD